MLSTVSASMCIQRYVMCSQPDDCTAILPCEINETVISDRGAHIYVDFSNGISSGYLFNRIDYENTVNGPLLYEINTLVC